MTSVTSCRNFPHPSILAVTGNFPVAAQSCQTENLHLALRTNTAHRHSPEGGLLSFLHPFVPAHSVSMCSTNLQCQELGSELLTWSEHLLSLSSEATTTFPCPQPLQRFSGVPNIP